MKNNVIVLQERIGEKLKENRRKRGEKLLTVTKATGIALSVLSGLENGKRPLNMATVDTLAQYYGHSLDDLLAP